MRRRDALCTLLYCLVGTPLAGLARASQTQRPCASPRTQYVYVSNERGRSISVVNDTTRQVEATIAVPGRPRGIQLSADGRTLYVALSDEAELVHGEQGGLSDDVSVIDTTTLQVVGTVATGEGPWGIAVGP
jgi:YVTN family beta-propeller protein